MNEGNKVLNALVKKKTIYDDTYAVGSPSKNKKRYRLK